uniref:Uncharacterized protein n=1 Tax=Panagrolaimus superbus TaxID=310955 RepID=A0A914XXE8_9BILA
MKLTLFALVFVAAILAVNAIFETTEGDLITTIDLCNAENRCTLPMGCFHKCYKRQNSTDPERCDNICVHKELRCKKMLNCPMEHKCVEQKCVPM